MHPAARGRACEYRRVVEEEKVFMHWATFDHNRLEMIDVVKNVYNSLRLKDASKAVRESFAR